MKPSVYSSPARIGILALTLAALALGGTSELWSQATMVLLSGLLLLFAPPRRALGRWPHFLLPALFVLSLLAFLPAAWSSTPPWRQHLENLGTITPIILPATRTVQPWLTAQACSQLFVGLIWAYYVLSQVWDSQRRLQAVRLLVLGIAVLATLATINFYLGFHIPTWNQTENRGWFPNRNHTADVLAICGVINYALIYEALRKKRKFVYLWIAALVLICSGLVVSYSRAGVLMFFGGVLIWHLWPTQRRGKRRDSLKWMMLSLSFAFVLLALFLLFGGDTLARFQGGGPPGIQGSDTYRVAIQEDALRFSLQSPLLGVGLGNFEPLFASARQASANENRALHPESDWLWAACELGWLAPVIFVAGIVWWLRRCLPFKTKPGESLRRACVVAGILFLLHGLVDVAGHHFASLWMGLLVLSLAMSDRAAGPRSRTISLLFRGLALPVLFVGGWWLASVLDLPVPPTTAELDRLARVREEAVDLNQLQAIEDLADATLQITPIDWHAYYQRGYAETFQPGKLARAGADFLVARNLQSKWVKPCFDEGATWLAADQPDLCIDAWEEALRRAKPEDIPDLYKEMLVLAGSNDLVHADLMSLAEGKIDYQLVFLGYATPDEANAMIADILAANPGLQALSRAQRELLFVQWWNHGDKAALTTQLLAHPEWLDAGWPYLAESYAAQKDYQHAWEVVAQHAPSPVIPAAPPQASLEDLSRSFYEQNDNVAAGILLALAQKEQGQTDDCLATLRALEKLRNCPKFIYFLEAQLWAAKQDWELAWQAWSSFRQP